MFYARQPRYLHVTRASAASAFALRGQHLQTTECKQNLCISSCVACAAFANDRAHITLMHQQLRCLHIICKLKSARNTWAVQQQLRCVRRTAFANDRAHITLVHQHVRCVRSISNDKAHATLVHKHFSCVRSICKRQSTRKTCASAIALWAHHLQTTGRTQHLCISSCVACTAFAKDRSCITLVHQQLRCVHSICK